MAYAKIVWNGTGGELDSVVVEDDEDESIGRALVKLISNGYVRPGDSFTIEEAPAPHKNPRKGGKMHKKQ